MRRHRAVLTMSMVGCLSIPSVALAQAPIGVAPGASFESYWFAEGEKVGVESVTLLTTPLTAAASVGPVRLTLAGAYASATVTGANGTESTLSGLVDTQLRADWHVVRDQLTLTVRGFLPTGQATHDLQESVVASIIAADLLPFRISNWGTGGGVFLEGTASRSFGDLGAGLSVGWGTSGEFEPSEGDAAVYQPGDQFSARVALDTRIGDAAKGSLLVGYRNYADDAFDERNLFRSGDRIEALASVGFPTIARGSASLYAGLLHREEGAVLVEEIAGSPSQDLVLIGGVWRLAIGQGWWQPRVNLRLFRREDGVGQGYNVGFGTSAELRVGSGVTLVPVLLGRIGNVEVREGLDSNFTGLEAGLALRFGR